VGRAVLSEAQWSGSLGQQPCGAAVSAAMVAPCVDGVLRAAIVVREPLPSVHGVGVVVGSCRQTAATSPRPPLLLRVSNRFALPPLIRPTNRNRSIAGKTSLPHRCEKKVEVLAREVLGKSDSGFLAPRKQGEGDFGGI